MRPPTDLGFAFQTSKMSDIGCSSVHKDDAVRIGGKTMKRQTNISYLADKRNLSVRINIYSKGLSG